MYRLYCIIYHLSIIMITNNKNSVNQNIGSSFSLPAHGLGGARATTITPPPEKFCLSAKQAGKKEGGLGEGIFARLLCRAKRGMGWEAARPCISKEAKPAKIVSLIEKDFCAHPLKEKEIFAGFACPAVSGASRWAGQSAKSSGFCLKKVRISSKTRSHIVCCCSAASALRASAGRPACRTGRFANIFQGFLNETKTFRSRKMRFTVAKQQNPALRDSQSFFSPVRANAKR